jgi:DNA-binding transcriptional regulator YiaG
MIRTVISLSEDDKRWLDRQAKQQQTTLANLIRQAVKQMRQTSELQEPSFEHLLASTQGIWEEGDGLSYQQALREEW